MEARQPLYGIPVLSCKLIIFNPDLESALRQLCLPRPNPLIKSRKWVYPRVFAFFTILSAAACAAYVVDLRAFLKPKLPEQFQPFVLPFVSIKVSIVLFFVLLIYIFPNVPLIFLVLFF